MEAPYPFTGEWSNGSPGSLCLFQQGPDAVIGRMDNHPAAGAIHPDGELVLALSGPGGELTIVTGRLVHRDTLGLSVRISNPVPLRRAAGTFVRQPKTR